MNSAEYPRPEDPKASTLPSGVVLGCGTAVVAIVLAILLPVFRSAHVAAVSSQCYGNLKLLSLGCLQYGEDFDQTLPDASRWMDLTLPYAEGEVHFHEPQFAGTSDYGYAFRAEASKLKLDKAKDPEQYVLLFDSNLLGRNAKGKLSTAPKPGRHSGRNNCGYLDGHVRWLPMQ